MMRAIVKLENSSLTLQLPEDLVGKTIEVIAFSLETGNDIEYVGDKINTVDDFKRKIKGFGFNSGGYRFNRDEANNYE